jgi:prevent-host-death family protein
MGLGIYFTLRPLAFLHCRGMPFFMKKAYTVKEAQRSLASLVRTAERGHLATITRHEQPVAYVIGVDRLAALAETMELLANPAAMQAIRQAEGNLSPVLAAKDLPE